VSPTPASRSADSAPAPTPSSNERTPTIAKTPPLKVYEPSGEYIAACAHAEDAAVIVAMRTGRYVRWQHGPIIYTEGTDGDAGASYDLAAAIMHARINIIQYRHRRKEAPNT